MVKSAEVMVHALAKPPPEDLESGRYKAIVHSTKFEVDPDRIDEFKEQYRKEWEAYEGVTVESVDIVQVAAGEKVSPKYIWYDVELGKTDVIEEAHTDVIVTFRVASPFPLMAVVALLLAGFILGLLAALIISGAFEPLFQFLYKHPEIIAAGLIVLLIFGLIALGVKVRKPPEERG